MNSIRYRRVSLLVLSGMLMLSALFSSCRPASDAVQTNPVPDGGKLTIESITPDTVTTDGGMEIVIVGDRFSTGTQITFDGVPARSVEFVDRHTIRVITPPLAPGVVTVVASNESAGAGSANANNGGGGADGRAEGQVTARLGVSPPVGPVTGGTTITIFNPDSRNNIATDDEVLFAVLAPGAPHPTENRFAFDTHVTQVDLSESTRYVNGSLMTAVAPPHAEGLTHVFIASNNGSTFFVGQFQYETAVPSEGGPRVVSAVSISNTSVLVTFSEAVQGSPGAGALDTGNYAIVRADESSGSAVLLVHGAAFSGSDQTSVILTTGPQSEVLYELTVTGVRDLAGNVLSPPERFVNPSRTQFVGTALSCLFGVCSDDGTKVCSSDGECGEQASCVELSKSVLTRACTHDGSSCTTDADCAAGLCLIVCDAIDTDEDGLSDAAEQRGWRVTVQLLNGESAARTVTSNPFVKDTDGDGLVDADEKAFGLDPRTADTDADQIRDFAELNVWFSDPWDQDTDDDSFPDGLEATFFRTSPILADTDGDQISDAEEILQRNRNPLVGDLPVPQITVDEIRLDLRINSSFTDEEGVVQSVTDSRSTSFLQSRTESTGRSDTTTVQSENQFSQSIGFEAGVSGGTFGGKVTGEVGFQQTRARGFSSTVDRQSAQTSQTEYQESVTNALERSERRSVTRTIEEAIVQATVNVANQSDIAFTITNIELSLLQQDRVTGLSFRPIAALRPTGANDPSSQPAFNLGPLDPERGPIIFENAEVFPNLIDGLMREPTGLIFQVANFDVLDEFGRNLVFTSQNVNDRTFGLTIDFGDGTVETYRIATASTFDAAGRPAGVSMQRALQIIELERVTPDTSIAQITAAVRNSYGTIVNNGVEELTRVRGVQNDLTSMDPQRRAWVALLSNPDLDPATDFSDIVLHAQDTVLLAFTRDVDNDRLFEREEYLYGSDDESTDTDADGIGDFDEVRVGWTVRRVPGLPYKAFPSPARGDSDLDGLQDAQEMPWVIDAGADGTCDTTTTAGDDENVALAGNGSSICVLGGANGRIDTSPQGDDIVIERGLGTDPNRADTDEDGLSDASELRDTFFVVLFDGDTDPFNNPELVITPYSDRVIAGGADGICDTTVVSGDDELIPPKGSGSVICVASGPNGFIDTVPLGDDVRTVVEKIAPGPNGICDTAIAAGDDVMEFADANDPPAKGSAGTVCISAGLNEELDTAPTGDDFVRVVHRALFSTNPLNRDTDADGIPDGRELLVGINPNARDAGNVIDTDGDGLFDAEEERGWLITVNGGTPTLVTSDKFRADTDRDGIPDVLERAIATDPRSRDTDGDTLFDLREFDVNDEIGIYDAVAIAEALDRCADARNCTYDPPESSILIGTDPREEDTDGDSRNDNVELTAGWTVQVFGGDPMIVFSDPKFADIDDDGLDDGQEFTHRTDPNDPDTDDDLRLDGAEIAASLDPLRQDKRLSVTLIDIDVLGDCDAATCEGLELEGSFQLQRPNGSDFTFRTENCRAEECACETRDCCQDEDPGENACDGQTISVNRNSGNFIFREGETFTLKSTSLRDHDDLDCDIHTLDDTIGSINETIGFALSLTTLRSIDVGSGGCHLRVNYRLNIVD